MGQRIAHTVAKMYAGEYDTDQVGDYFFGRDESRLVISRLKDAYNVMFTEVTDGGTIKKDKICL